MAELHKAVAIAAPTGTAARIASTGQVTGRTIHLLFNIRRRKSKAAASQVVVEWSSTGGCEDPDEDAEEGVSGVDTAVLDAPTRQRLAALRLLIVDECSMVDKSKIELMDEALRTARAEPDRVFGGCVLLFCGDFFQLRPVNGTGWAFEAEAFPTPQRSVQLTQVVRQADDLWFSSFLNRMRVGEHTREDLAQFFERRRRATLPSASGDPAAQTPFSIVPFNRQVAAINVRCMAQLDTEPRAFAPIDGGYQLEPGKPWRPFPLREEDHLGLPSLIPPGGVGADALLLKVGCRVRCTRNVYAGRYPNRRLVLANGQRGRVVRFDEDPMTGGEGVCVRWDAIGDGKPETIDVGRHVYRRVQRFQTREGNTIVATRAQLPLAVAYAITIHGAQGASLDMPHDVDPSSVTVVGTDEQSGKNVWGPTPGGAYVACSRATRAEHMQLLAPLKMSQITADPQVLAFHRTLPV